MKRPASFAELCYQAMVELGGGTYRGLQPGIPGRIEPMVLFCGQDCSTLAVHISELSADRVRKEIQRKKEEFDSFNRTHVETVWQPPTAA